MFKNAHLYEAYTKAAESRGLKVYAPNNGSCLYVKLPEHIASKFWCMLWTPINRLNDLFISRDRRQWRKNIQEVLNANYADWHLEFSHKHHEQGSYAWFPEINYKPKDQITQADIEACFDRMLDESNWHKHELFAVMQEADEDVPD